MPTWYGNYDSSSFNLHGTGTFRAGEGCHPFCGEVGELHTESEVRIETILPAYRKGTVLRALLSVHPYEEPAFDFYRLENSWEQAGSGVVGELPEEEEELAFLQRIKDLFHVGCVKYSALTGNPIRDDILLSTRDEGLMEFSLDPAKKTVLVSGGSRGAHSINKAMLKVHKHFANNYRVQIMHVTGKTEYDFVKNGLEEIKAAGEKFDPNFHQAVMRVQDPEKEDDTIEEVLQKGYMVQGRVIRPSMVKVVAN